MRVSAFLVLVALACSALQVSAASLRSSAAGSLDPAAIVADLTKQSALAAGNVTMPPEIQREIAKASAATTAALASTQTATKTPTAAPAPVAPAAPVNATAPAAPAPVAAPKPVNDEEEGSTPPPGWTPPRPLQSLAAEIQKQVAAAAGPPPLSQPPVPEGFSFQRGMNVLWGVNKDGQAVSRINGVHPGARWVAHKKRTDLASIVASPNRKSRAVFALTTQGQVLQRANVTRHSPLGKGWTKLVGSLTSLAVTGSDALWGVTAASLVFYKSSGSATDASWTKVAVPADLQLKQISAAGYKHVVGLTKDGAVVVRKGIKRGRREGKAWKKAPAVVGATSAPKFDMIAVGPKGQLWGLDAAGSVFYAANSTAEWSSVKDLPTADTKFRSLSVANDGQLIAVSTAGPVYARRGISKRARTGMGMTWAKVPRSTKARLLHVAAGASIRAKKAKSTMPGVGKPLSKKQLRAHSSRTFSLRFTVPDSKFGRDSSKLRLRKALARIGGISLSRVSILSIKPATNLPNQSEITFKFARVGSKSAAKKHHKKGAKGHGKGKKGVKKADKKGKGSKKHSKKDGKGSKKHSKKDHKKKKHSKKHSKKDGKGKKKHGKKSGKKHSKKHGKHSKKHGKGSKKHGKGGKKASKKHHRKERSARKALAKVASRLRFRSVLTQVQKGILKSVVASSLTVIGKKGTRHAVTPKPLKRKPSFRNPTKFKRAARIVFVQKRKAGANYTAPFVLSASTAGGLVLSKRAKKSANPSQLWRLSKDGQLSFTDAKGVKQCAESAPRPAGATKVRKLAVNISPCVASSPLQKFEWLRRGNRVRAVGSKMCLTVENRDKDGDRVPLEQARVVLHKCSKKGGRRSNRQKFGFKQARRSRAHRARALGFSVTISSALKSLAKDYAASVSADLGKAVNAPAARFNVTRLAEAPKSAQGKEQTSVVIAVLPSKDKAAPNATVLLAAVNAALSNSATVANNAFLKSIVYGSLAQAKLPRKQHQHFKADKASKIELYAAPGSVIEAAWGGKAGRQTELVIAEYNPMSASQVFSLSRKSGALTFVDRFNVTRCVELRKNKKDAAAAPRLISARCKRTGSRSQTWRYDSRVQALRHVASRQCLALPASNTKPGTKLAMRPCDVTSSEQMWDYPARYPSDIRVQLARAKAAEEKAEAEAKRVIEQVKRIELEQKALAAQTAKKAAAEAAKAVEVKRKARAKRQAEVQLLALKKTVPKNTYALSVKAAIRASSAAAGLPGSSASLTCRDLSNMFGIASGASIGVETPSLYRQAWAAKKCATVPLSCQELTDCYDFEHMAANNAAALVSGFAPGNASEQTSAPFAPIMIVQNYLSSAASLAAAQMQAAGKFGAAVREANATAFSFASPQAQGRQCAGFRPLDCAGLSEYYGISASFAGTAPKCVQKKFKALGCSTAPAQTCQVLSNRFGLGAPATKAPTEAAATKALSARFMALAGLSRAEPAAANTVVVPSASDATFIAPEKAASIFAERRCATKPASCQSISTKFKCWPGHQGKASDDTFRQFNLRGCKTRPALTCAQLSDSFLFGDHTFHPKPEAHGHTAASLGADVFNYHAALSADTAPTSFMELGSTYSGTSLRNAPYKRIDAAYFVQWVKRKCTTVPHTCEEMSAIYGLSPNSRGAATAAIERVFTSKLKCSTHPLLSCAELSMIYGLTAESVHEASVFLRSQWAAQKCSTSIPSCQEMSDSYDLPRGEWSSYAPSGVTAQFNALGCSSEPLPSCAALSDYYSINHSQTDPSTPPDAGKASRLILAKYSRWGCHHAPRDCQALSDYFGIGVDKQGKMTAGKNTPQYAKNIFRFRKCNTSPIEGAQPGQVANVNF